MDQPEYYRRFTGNSHRSFPAFVNLYVKDGRFVIETGEGKTWDSRSIFELDQIQEIAIELLNLGAEVEAGTGQNLNLGQEAFSSKEKFQALQQILDSLSPQETEKLKRGDWQQKEVLQYIGENEKPEYVDKKPEVLARLRQKFGRSWFATRDTYSAFSGWSKQRSRDWISRLQRGGYLKVREAEHPDPQVRREYRISKQGMKYLRRHSI